MKPRKDISGQRFGEWTALEYLGNKYWKCQCSCGNVHNVDGATLRNGVSTKCKSCGQRKYAKGDYASRLYTIWNNMKQRCHNPENTAYKWYGAKGTIVCDEWKTDFTAFKTWALTNQYTATMTIDRIDNSKGYHPDNCQWITLSENVKKSQDEREMSPLNTTGELHISWNSYKFKYDVTINHTYVGSYHTIEAAILDRDWFAQRELDRLHS